MNVLQGKQWMALEQIRDLLRTEQNDEQSDLSYDHLSSCRYVALNGIRCAIADLDRALDKEEKR